MLEADQLRKAIWDMMNFANMYVLVLDDKMNVRFANWSLYTALGFEDHMKIVGRCWLDFIKKEDSNSIVEIHHAISSDTPDASLFNEYTNDIVAINGEIISVKWFNAHINTDYNWSFSIGIQTEKPVMVTEESIRTYYNKVIDNDRTMIHALRNSILRQNKEIVDACEPDME